MTPRIESVAINAALFERLRNDIASGALSFIRDPKKGGAITGFTYRGRTFRTSSRVIYKDASEGSPLQVRVGPEEVSLLRAMDGRRPPVFKVSVKSSEPIDSEALSAAIAEAVTAKRKQSNRTVQEAGEADARERTQQLTYREWADRYFALAEKETDLRTLDDRRRTIDRLFIRRPLPSHLRKARLQTYGDLKPGGITLADANEWRRDLAEENGKTMAQLARSFINSMFSFLIANDGFAADLRFPITTAVRFTAREKEEKDAPDPLTDSQIKMLWDATEEIDDLRRAFVRFLLLSGRRRIEAEKLQWSWIKLEDGHILFPAAAMKNKQPFAQPLTPAIIDILKALPKFGDHVFSMPSGKPMGRDQELLYLLDARMCGRAYYAREFAEAGIPFKKTWKRNESTMPFQYRIHSFRSTATRLLQRADRDLTEVHFQYLLAHSGPKGAIRNYVGENMEKKREMLELLESEIFKIVNPPSPEQLKERALQSIIEAMAANDLTVQDIWKEQAKRDAGRAA